MNTNGLIPTLGLGFAHWKMMGSFGGLFPEWKAPEPENWPAKEHWGSDGWDPVSGRWVTLPG